jgi:hypothetical protein
MKTDVSDSSDVHSEILEEKLIPLLLGYIGPDRAQVDADSKALNVGDMMKGVGGDCGHPPPPWGQDGQDIGID